MGCHGKQGKSLCNRGEAPSCKARAFSPFGSWLQFWPKCASHWKRWKSDYLAKLRRRDVLIGVPLSKWMDFQLGFFARKLVVGITQHLSALGVLGLAGKLHIRRARSSNFHPFQKFTSLSDGNKISHHCQIKRGSRWFVETSSHLSSSSENEKIAIVETQRNIDAFRNALQDHGIS